MKTSLLVTYCTGLFATVLWAQQPCPKAKGGFLPSMQPITVEVPSDSGSQVSAKGHAGKNTPKKSALPWPEMTKEEGFYFWVAVYGASADMVDKYARVFDSDNYRRAMANEFERSKYRKAMEDLIRARADGLTFDEKFTFMSWRDSNNGAKFGEYSFEKHEFPIKLPDTGFSYFNYWVGGNGFDVNPFDLGMALNATDFSWTLPMSEEAGAALLKSRPNRIITLRIVYSVTRDKNDVNSSRYYLTPFIHSIEAFADPEMTKPLGSLAMNPTAPRDPKAWASWQEEAARLLIGTWRDENSVITYSGDGTCTTKWDNGTSKKRKWSLSRGVIDSGNVARILSISPTALVTLDSQCKTWHAKRISS